jgi:hypothetical protein
MDTYNTIREQAIILIEQREQEIYNNIDYLIKTKDYINGKIAKQQSKGYNYYYVFKERHNHNMDYNKIFKHIKNHEGLSIIERLRYLYQKPFKITYQYLDTFDYCYIKIKWRDNATCILQ